MAGTNPPAGKTKLTINIDPELKRWFKTEAAQQDRDMQALVVEALLHYRYAEERIRHALREPEATQ